MRATRAHIHLGNLAHNLASIRAQAGAGPGILLPVKADAYGHGAVEISRAALSFGVRSLAVASVEEGAQLRSAGIACPIFLFSLALPDEYPALAELGIEPLLGDAQTVDVLDAALAGSKRRLTVHLKIDTGMGRIGCRPEAAMDIARRVRASRNLSIGGLFTHFPVSDESDPASMDFTRAQLERFTALGRELSSAGFAPAFLSASNSGAILSQPGASLDLIRPGILAYGYHPNPAQRPLSLRPVMSLVSSVIFLKTVEPGETVSYGRTWKAPARCTVATLPLGYADGYPRALSGRGRVLIRGQSYPVIGRVCMDQLMVDLGRESDVRLHDQAVLFGAEEGAPGADDLAAACGTIPYEITCNVNKRVPRVFLDA